MPPWPSSTPIDEGPSHATCSGRGQTNQELVAQNRRAAPALFEQELKAALARIRAAPTLGVVYRPGHFEVPVRRVLLPKTRHHVYYAVEQRVVVVLSVWGAQQRQDPIL